MDDALCFLNAAALSELLRDRKVSPLEIVDAHLNRIARLDERINAFISADAERARAEARAAEAELAAGRSRGPLHGIPVAHKDIFDVAGLGTTAGSRITSNHPAVRDAGMVARVRATGAITLGKTNTTEFAAGGMDVFGEAHNPWDLQRSTGTSSAGSAAALAAHMIPLATGSDTGGSIRIPAAYCGVVGLKPTFGSVSSQGMVPFSPSFDHPGPMARTVADVLLLLRAMTEEPIDGSTATVGTTLRGVKLGIPNDHFFERLDGEVAGRVDAAIACMRALGAQTREIAVEHLGATAPAFWAIAYSEALAFQRPSLAARHADFTTPLLHRLLAAACLSDDDLDAARQIRSVISAELGRALHDVDALVTPTAPEPASLIGEKLVHADRNRFTRPANLAGIPALSIPCGFSSNGLPIGLQLVGRAFGEMTLLGIASVYERATNWNEQRAPLAQRAAAPAAGTKPAEHPSPGEADAGVLEKLHALGFSFVDEEVARHVADVLAPVQRGLRDGLRLIEA